MRTTAILVDDHALMRDGLRMILKQIPDLEIVGEATNGREAIELARRLCPDVVMMDVGMSDLNGIEATRQICSTDHKVKVIALSAYADRRFVMGMLDAGAVGYVHKSAAGRELVEAVAMVRRGKRYLSSEVAGVVIDVANGLFPSDPSTKGILSRREREVLQLVAEGKSSSEISHRLRISARTVETHRRNLMAKLDLHSAAELTKYAVREGMTDLER